MHESLVLWWNGISLRTKITGVTVLLLTTGLVVSGFGTMYVMRTYLLDEVDRQLTSAASALPEKIQFGASSTSSDAVSPTDYLLAAVDSDGEVAYENTKWSHADNPPDVRMMDLSFLADNGGKALTVRSVDNTTQWRVVVTPVYRYDSSEVYSLVIGLPLDNTNNVIARMFTIFFLFGLVVVLLGAALTRFLVTSTFGPLRQVEKTAAAIADGDFSQRLAGATPNTEVGRLNRSLNTMLNRIDRAFDDRAATISQMRRFVGDASHELRTPLVSVRGYAELYRMGALQTPEEIAQAMDRIEREAIRMGGLVEDLLELARLDETKPLKLAPVELLPLATDAALDAMASSPTRVVTVLTGDAPPSAAALADTPPETPEPAIAATATSSTARTPRRRRIPSDAATSTGRIMFGGIALARLRRRQADQSPEVEVVPLSPSTAENAAPALVMAEENKIRQVLTNLLGNAARFTPPDSPIEIAVLVDRPNDKAILEVIDHGEGIPPQVRDKIFQRFWRADSSRTRDTGGSGLGLAIVSAIVAAHKGTVSVEETPGGGATFRVTLPLLTSAPPREVSTDSDDE